MFYFTPSNLPLAGQKQLVNLADFSLPWLRRVEVLQFFAGVVPT
jgi:hypothetical protein